MVFCLELHTDEEIVVACGFPAWKELGTAC
jgi:hypothetical protein